MDSLKQPQNPSHADSIDQFIVLVEKAQDLHSAGKAEECLRLARSAQQLEPQLPTVRNVKIATAMNQLGMIFFEIGYNQDALKLYTNALNIAKKLKSVNKNLLADLKNNLGQVLTRLGNYDKAKSSYEAALLLREQESPGSLAHAVVLDNFAATLNFLGEMDKALSMHEQALGIFENFRGPIDVHVATTLGNMSDMFLLQGNFEKAEAYRLRALDTHMRLTGMYSAGTLLNIRLLAEIYMEKGEQPRVDGLVNLLLSAEGGKIGKGHRFLAEMLFGLTQKAFYNFQLDLAERLGTMALEAFEKTEGMVAPETMGILHLLANIQRATNHIGSAQENYKRALDGYSTLKKTESVAQVTIDLGKTYRDNGSYDLAHNLFAEAIKLLRDSAGEKSAEIASALGNLAVLYYESEQYDLAEQTYVEALDEIQTDPKNIERPWLLHNRGMLKYHLGDYDSARLLYTEAKKLWSDMHSDEHPFVATTASNLGLVHWAMGNIENSIDCFTEAEALRDRDMQRILAVGSETKRAAYARNLVSDLHLIISLCFAAKPYNEEIGKFAAQMLLRRKGRVLDAIAHTYVQTREHLRSQDRAIFDRLETIRGNIANIIAPVLGTQRTPQEPQQLKKLREEEEALEAKLSYRGALYQPALEKVTLEAVQRHIPNDGVLVELLRYRVFDPERTGKKGAWKEERYAAMVLRSKGCPNWFDLGLATDIDSQAHTMLQCLRRPTSSIKKCDLEAAKLYEFIIEPLQGTLTNIRYLFVGPDGHLALVPFGVLLNKSGRRLSEEHIINYVTTGRELAFRASSQTQNKSIVVIAAPDFDGDAEELSLVPTVRFPHRGGKFQPLKGTEKEGREIVRMLDQAELITGANASVAALKAVKSPTVLHIATHGLFSPMDDSGVSWSQDVLAIADEVLFINQAAPEKLANPMYFSALALAGANNQDKGVHGIITGQELAGIDLRGTQLVILSACETGLGTVKLGEEFTGLRRALGIAGAATQVTSLWKVHDEATKSLMLHYYRSLLDGHGRAEALYLAQQQVAHDKDRPEWKHPFYWAAFVSAGDWRPMKDFLNERH